MRLEKTCEKIPAKQVIAAITRSSCRAYEEAKHSAQSSDVPRIDANCSLAQFAAQMQRLNVVCCPSGSNCTDTVAKKLPSQCNLDCANVFVPMFRDCRDTINRVFDVHSSDSSRDANASAFYAFDQECTTKTNKELVARINNMTARGCNVNTTSIAIQSQDLVSTCQFHDDDKTLQRLTGHTCQQSKAQSLCRMLHFSGMDKLCPCACASTTGWPFGDHESR